MPNQCWDEKNRWYGLTSGEGGGGGKGEANQVTDILSKVGAQGSLSVTYTSHSELPRPAKGAMCLDSAGIPVIRIQAVCH